MQQIFNGCSKLQTVYVGANWSTASATNGHYIFNGCFSLVGGNGTKVSDESSLLYARIDKPGQPGYFTDIKYKPATT